VEAIRLSKVDCGRWYPETERLIAVYWKKCMRIERLRAIETSVKASLYEVDRSLHHFKRLPGLTAQYGYHPGGSGGFAKGIGDLVADYEQEVEKLVKQLLERSRRLVSIQSRIHQLEEWCAPFTNAFAKFGKEGISVLEQRYIYRRSNYQIAELLHMSEPTVRRMVKRMITVTADWLGKR